MDGYKLIYKIKIKKSSKFYELFENDPYVMTYGLFESGYRVDNNLDGGYSYIPESEVVLIH